jgi:predicted amidohydrolase
MRPLAVAAVCAALGGCGDEAEVVEPRPPVVPEPEPATCDAYAFSGSGVRFFVVQPKLRPEVWVSFESYRAHLVDLVEERVVPCLASDRPNVIVLPENAGLHAAFLGERGEAARTEATSIGAFLALTEPLAPAVAYYDALFGPLDLAEGLVLALTDTIWRAFDGTMQDIAARTGAYVIANGDVAGTIAETTDPGAVSALVDPTASGTASAYAAEAPASFNTAYVYAPDGTIVARRSKPYLVPSEESELRLAYGRLEEVVPVDLGFVKLGIATSKDAWMPDVVDRLEALGTEVLVQPEAFSGWGIEEVAGDWLPEVVAQSGWAATQKHGGIRYAVIPHMTGNLFDMVFDGQSAIFGDATPGSAKNAYVGLEPMGGVIAVAPWLVEDPGAFDPTLPLASRRATLRDAALAALPGGSRENAYVETIVAADLDPRAPFPTTDGGEPAALGASREVAPDGSAAQTSPRLASSGEDVLLVWAEDAAGVSTVLAARSTDGGASFLAPVRVASSTNPQITPAVAMQGSTAVVAWQERSAEGARVLVARSTDGGASFAQPSSPTGASAGADEWSPAVALDDGGEAVVAFVAMVDDNERVMVSRSAGQAWSTVEADAEAPAHPAQNPRNNQWSPTVAVSGTNVAVAWVDFRAYQWDVYLARSTDGGASFGAPIRVDDATEMPERIHDDPRVVFDSAGAVLCVWTDVRLRRGASRARVARISGTAAEPSRVLGSVPDTGSTPTSRPAIALSPTGGAVAVWQDLRGGVNDLYVSVSASGTAFEGDARLDDGGDGPGQELQPDVVVLSNGRVVAAWEDTRSGVRRVRVAAASL